MSDRDADADIDLADLERAELALEVGERLRRGEQIRAADYPGQLDAIRNLLPTLKLLAGMPLPPPSKGELSRLGEYRLIREVSRGGMGIVYEAIQEPRGRRVALKVLPEAAALDGLRLRRFLFESQAAARLDHPNIVPIHAIGSEAGIHYHAMRFIDGRDLARIIRSRRTEDASDPAHFPDLEATLGGRPRPAGEPTFAREVARLARQAALALDHAHSNQVLHGDIKPSNLLVDETGKLWVTDFGLAQILGGSDRTVAGELLGTPRYLSPEQILDRHRASADGRSDIYALGATFYELLTLRPAFPGEDRLELLRRIASEEPDRPTRIDPTIPVDLESIVLKAMAKSPRNRYATALDLAEDLDRFLGGPPTLECQPGFVGHVTGWIRRHRSLRTRKQMQS